MKIVINRSDAIGDNLLTLPMAYAIKKEHPQAHIIFIISKRMKELIKLFEVVDEYWLVEDIKIVEKNFKKNKIDYYFHVGGSEKPSLLAWKAKIPFRGGLKSRLSSFFLLNKGVRQKRSEALLHESQYNLDLLKPMGIDVLKSSSLEPIMKLNKEQQKNSHNIFLSSLEKNSKPTNRKLFFVHPGMSGHTLNWPGQSYVSLIEEMEAKFPGEYLYIISFTPSDEAYLKELREAFSQAEHVYFFDGSKEGLLFYVNVLSYASYFVGPSTGTTHIANILKIPQIGIYSPIKVQSKSRWGTYSLEASHLFSPDVECPARVKCEKEACQYYPCMEKIKTDDVIRKIK